MYNFIGENTRDFNSEQTLRWIKKLLKKTSLSSDTLTLEVTQISYYDSKFQERNILKISFYLKFINNKSIVPKLIAV